MYQYNFNKSSTGAPFITLDQIESLTEQILNKYCPSAIENFEAVDIEGLAEFDLGFNVEYAYLSHNGCYAGMMVFNDDQVIRTMKEFDYGLEIYKDGSIIFVDSNNGDRYKISAEDLQDLYDKTEV